MTQSWYEGSVFVGLKEGIFEPSSPARHMTELCDIMQGELTSDKSVLFIYSDGRPDHRLTYLSVQLSLILLYLKLDLDYLCAARTAPCHSWRNPAERVMSIVNLGLQCVGLMRQEMSDDHEAAIASCNSMSQIRQVSEKKPEIVLAVLDSIAPVKILLSDILKHVELHGKKFQVFSAASEQEIKDLWAELSAVDELLEYGGQYQKKILRDHPQLVAFISHCCQVRHYSFTVKKCGVSSCTRCKPVHMARRDFEKLSYLPDPIPGEDGHYQRFSTVYGTSTSEEHRPSLQSQKSKQKSLPFPVSVQHVRNADTMIQCEECEVWRLVYSKYKLTATERQTLQSRLEDYTYTCGAKLSDLGLEGRLGSDNLCVRSIRCYEPLEKLYFSAGQYELICIFCCSNKNIETKEGCYPQCSDCASKEPIKKRK